METKLRFSQHALNISERPKAMYVYYVSGRGEFPFDMLRYDSCWPSSSEDAAQLSNDPFDGKVRSIEIRSYQEPNIARWSSFLWSVGTEKL